MHFLGVCLRQLQRKMTWDCISVEASSWKRPLVEWVSSPANFLNTDMCWGIMCEMKWILDQTNLWRVQKSLIICYMSIDKEERINLNIVQKEDLYCCRAFYIFTFISFRVQVVGWSVVENFGLQRRISEQNEYTDVWAQVFHTTVLEYIIFLHLFLYLSSYVMNVRFRSNSGIFYRLWLYQFFISCCS